MGFKGESRTSGGKSFPHARSANSGTVEIKNEPTTADDEPEDAMALEIAVPMENEIVPTVNANEVEDASSTQENEPSVTVRKEALSPLKSWSCERVADHLKTQCPNTAQAVTANVRDFCIKDSTL